MRKPRKVARRQSSSSTDSSSTFLSTQAGIGIDSVIDLLKDAADGLPASDIADELDLSASARKALPRFLSQLQGTGLIRSQGNDYRWSHSPRVLIGILRQRRRKTISFVPDDPAERLRGRIRIAPEDTGNAFDGDRIIASLARQNTDALREAKVVLIVARGQLRIVGRLHHGFRDSWVESLDERLSIDIDLPQRDAKDLADGSIVLVEITRYPSGRERAAGRLIERLGESSEDPGMDIEIVIRKHDLPVEFPEEVQEQADQVPLDVLEEQLSGRLDLRQVPTVTIDGETARDFDDAISLRRLDHGNFLLGVHIADVSHYVTANSPLDSEARLRGTSVY
ncbi:MAG: RNB domain-containing ribonuclease, partial [Acidobacteriota bacterium]